MIPRDNSLFDGLPLRITTYEYVKQDRRLTWGYDLFLMAVAAGVVYLWVIL